MTTHSAKMRVCPNCHVPNSPRLEVCFTCGYVLDSALQAAPELFDARGTAAPVNVVLPSAILPLPGWKVSPQADGSVQLQRTGWRRFFDQATLPVVFLFLGILCLCPGSVKDRTVHPPMLALWHCFGILVLAFGVGAGLWQFGAKEIIRVGHGVFERTMTLGPIRRWWRFEHSAGIRIETRQGSDRNGAYTSRRLLIENLGQRMTLEQRYRRDSLFSFGVHTPVVEDDVSALGRYLSDLTGWSLTDPELGRY